MTSAGCQAEPAIGAAKNRSLLWIAGLVLLVLLGLRVQVGMERFLGEDELWHLNVAWFVSHGETLYGSVFENHPPLMALTLQPIVRSSESPRTIIRRARAAMAILQLGILITVGAIALRVAGPLAALLAPALLLSQTVFFQKALEIRPDVPATLCFVLSLERLGSVRRDSGWCPPFSAGALLCLAGLFTPKLIYAAAGAAGAMALATHWRGPSRWLGAGRSLAWVGLGAAAVAGIVFAEMARQGILVGFFQDAVVQSLRMTVGDPARIRYNWLSRTLEFDAVSWCLALVGTGLALTRRLPGRGEEIAILLVSLWAGLLGLFFISAPFRQYYLCFLPQTAIFAAATVSGGTRRLASRTSTVLASVCLVLALGICLALPLRYVMRSTPGMDEQLAIMDAVLEASEPDERVLDCWSGLYLTRLPAYRYAYLTPDVQSLIDPEKLERELLETLEDSKVVVHLRDRACQSLPPRVLLALDERFVPHPRWPGKILLRKRLEP